MPRPSLALLVLCLPFLVSSPSLAQELTIDAADASRTPGKDDPARAAWEAARESLKRGELEEARRHLRYVRDDHPFAGEVLKGLVDASASPEERLAWWRAYVLAEMDERGRFRMDRASRRDQPEGADVFEELGKARVEAMAELATLHSSLFRKRGRRGGEHGQAALARWATELARELQDGFPALQREHARSWNQRLASLEPDYATVFDGVVRAMRRAQDEGRHGDAIRLARFVTGLAAQSRFQGLRGPQPPDIGPWEEIAREVLDTARAALAEQQGVPYTLDALDEMDEQERERFSREHEDFGLPAIAFSPNRWYRIETTCGFETLHGTARTIELHHRRLVRWYGVDPFENTRGLVRIVPESNGLESEGTPFWWATGFQSGNRTTVKFTCGTIAGLGRTLVHELTHRFDGALYPGLPSWMTEGRAVWTGAAYGSVDDETFHEDHASTGPIERALIQGYASRDSLRDLIEGKIEEYRHNYTAGYALWVYLWSWRKDDGGLLFRSRLEPFMKEIVVGNANRLAWFERHFADGKDGRPKGFDEFAKGFAEFLKGFHWRSREPWTNRYQVRLSKERETGYVYEDEAWSFERSRAEPFFGQNHAGDAADELVLAGEREAAAAAYEWSTFVDEWNPERMARFADLLEELKAEDAAWALRMLDRQRLRSHGLPLANEALPCPFESSLRRVRAWQAKLRAAATSFEEKAPSIAAGLRADAARVSILLGEEGVRLAPSAFAEGAPLQALDPSRALRLAGYEDAGLTGFEDRRVAGLWYETEEGHLHVGRSKPRRNTGSIDRSAHQRDAFALSHAWQAPGRYRVTTRVHFTTSYVSGAVILGWTRRDRNVRFSFRSGDFMYAIGEKDEAAQTRAMAASLEGLWVRDEHLVGSRPAGNVSFPRETSSFDLEILVDGPMAHVSVDGNFFATYHTLDGQPLEGRIGFAAGMGAYLVERPRVQRFDRTQGAALERPWPPGLRLRIPEGEPPKLERNRPVEGIDPHPRGTIVLWIPAPRKGGVDEDVAYLSVRIKRIMERLAQWVTPYRLTPGYALVVSDRIQGESLEALRKAVDAADPGRWKVYQHDHREPFPSEETPSPESVSEYEDRAPWVFYLDPRSVLRVTIPYDGSRRRIPEHLRHWARVYGRRPLGESR